LRHAIAAQRDNSKYPDDSQRPLTAHGRQKMHDIACGMRMLGLSWDAILCSPYVRARQTAAMVARVFKLKNAPINFTNNLVPDASFEELCQEIRTNFPQSQNILFVGHEPHLTQLIACLLKSKSSIPINLKKGGLCHLSQEKPFGEGSAVLNWILTPSQLCLIALKKNNNRRP